LVGIGNRSEVVEVRKVCTLKGAGGRIDVAWHTEVNE
jgi:hypothetical protein